MNIKLLPILLTVLVLVNGCRESVTEIKGVINADTNLLLYSNPDLDISYRGFMDTVMLNKDGSFKLNLNLKENQFIILNVPALDREYILPIQKGGSYDVSIGKDNELDVKGHNEDGIKLYQSVLQYKPGNIDWNQFDSIPSDRDKTIEQVKREELDGFLKLLEEEKITRAFYRLVESDRNCFYGFVSSWLYSWDMMGIYRNDEAIIDEEDRNETLSRLSEMYSRYDPNDKNIMKSPSWVEYALFMYVEVYTLFLNEKINSSNIEKILLEQNIPFWFEQVKANFSGRSLEPMLAVFLYKRGGAQNFTVSELIIPAFEYFRKSFPESNYSKYFVHHMNKTLSFYEEERFDSSIYFIEERDSIHSFEKLISRFKGKKVYVDVWASWCNPCRAEFQFHDSLKAILQENNIIPLFISLDEDNQEQRWKSLVHVYNLKGAHYRANASFTADLNRIYHDNENGNHKEEKTFSIPWYMLIDENGDILEKHFKRPSIIVSSGSLLD